MNQEQLADIKQRFHGLTYHGLSSEVVKQILDTYQQDMGALIQHAEKTLEQAGDQPEIRPFGGHRSPVENPDYATAAQKEEIIRLLNHPFITRPEKTKMLLNLNRLDQNRAKTAIGKLNKAIQDRT